MLTRPRLFLLVVLLLLYSPSSKGQDRKNDIVRVRTRVVFIDTLVQDKETGAPVADLTRENFQALAAVRSLPMPEPTWYHEELTNIAAKVERAAAERPDSQIIIVTLSPVVWPMRASDRDKIVARLIRANVFFSPLIRDAGNGSVKMKHVPGKYPLPPRPIFDAIGGLVGTDIYAPGHIAEQTGGEATAVHRPEDYGAAVEKLIAGLAARYNLGFMLKEDERDDGHLAKLGGKVKASHSSGKERKLVVKARRGYYMKIQEPPPGK